MAPNHPPAIEPAEIEPARPALLVGIDIGGTSLKGAVVDAQNGVILHSDEVKLPVAMHERTPGLVIALADTMISRLVHAAGAAHGDITALGVGCPGLIRRGVVHAAGNFPSWREVNLVSEFAALLPRGTRLAVTNDAHAAALAEAWVGIGRHATVQNLVMLTLGTGIGIGVLIDGQPLVCNVEGGHAIIRPGGRACVCGQHGCFEAHCSASAIAARANEALGKSSAAGSLRALGRALVCEDLFDPAHANDALCAAVLADAVQDLALGCLNLCRAFDPDVLVLAGGLSGAADRLIEPLRAELKRIWWQIGPTPTICVAHAGSKSGVVGAAAAVRGLPPARGA
ncbi:hypothetical protein KFE25_000677 [Diacronema lutheri]|uniref:Glucokinase n=1 Tax=Diacronema lutheri TaxID=2081491 RepID=A0A8J6CDR5_DIALT|nr:hypothetical protein KFE25_000677 [Diacronema lutheri]